MMISPVIRSATYASPSQEMSGDVRHSLHTPDMSKKLVVLLTGKLITTSGTNELRRNVDDVSCTAWTGDKATRNKSLVVERVAVQRVNSE